MPITISDVAKKAGVATSTVSKVLNNYDKVSEETKQKVLLAASELNYVPNTMASALSSKRYDCIGLYIYINNQRQAIDEINMQYLFGAFQKAKELGIKVMTIFSSTVSELNKDELIHYLQSLGITSLVIYGLNKDDRIMHSIIHEQLFSIVVVDAPIINEKTSSVSVDHTKGQYDVALKIIDQVPCQEVLYLAGRKDGYVTDERLAGIMKLQKERKFRLNVQYSDFSEKKARMLTKRFGDKSDVIICASDLMAIGAISSLKEMNIYRPCCGYDGITLMGYVAQNVWTCKQDFYKISQSAIEEADQLLHHGQTGRKISLGYDVIQLVYDDVIM